MKMLGWCVAYVLLLGILYATVIPFEIPWILCGTFFSLWLITTIALGAVVSTIRAWPE